MLNQKHLLRDLHTSKNACTLLLPSPKDREKMNARPVARADPIEINDSPYFSAYKTFRPGCFECAKVADISLELHASAVINQDTAIKKLEVIISMFAVNNVDRVFVTQDAQGNVFYMKFVDPDATMKSTIVLGIYGITAVDATMYSYLQTLLQSKLIDLAAKAMSTILMRNNSISLQYITYMKNSGYNSRSKKYKLPAYVSDAYLYAMIVKQVMLASQCLTPISYQSPPPRRFIHSEYSHPATLGYDFSSIITESVQSTGDEKFSDSASKVMRLRRSEHVQSGDFDIHPVFSGQSKRNLSLLKEDRSADIRRIIWSQNEFTFLYNVFPKEQKEKDLPSHSKSIVKHIGHGLALVEVGLDTNIHLKVGSKNSLLHDVRHLNYCLRNGLNLRLLGDSEEMEDSSIHGARNRAEVCQSVWLKVYPTMPMNDDRLQVFCDSIFEHALYLYCIQRLVSFGRYYVGMKDEMSIFSAANRYSSMAAFTHSEVIRLIHEIQLQCPHPLSSSISTMISTGLRHFPSVLPVGLANTILSQLNFEILEMYPNIRRSEALLSSMESVFSSSTEQMSWHHRGERSSRNISLLFGDVAQDLPSINHALEIRFINDLDSQAPISDWLRKRHSAIEIVISPTGVYFFYFNIQPNVIRSICDLCEKLLNLVKPETAMKERRGLEQLGVSLIEISSTEAQENQSLHAMIGQINRLSWERKAVSRLYLNISTKCTKKVRSLDSIDPMVWRKGLMITQQLFPLLIKPQFDLFGRILERLQDFSDAIDIDLISFSEIAFIIAPIPNTCVVFIAELQRTSDGLLVIERMNDLATVIDQIATTPALQNVISDKICLKDTAMSFAKYRQQSNFKGFEKIILNHKIVQMVRGEIFPDITSAVLETLFSDEAHRTYEQFHVSLDTLRFVWNKVLRSFDYYKSRSLSEFLPIFLRIGDELTIEGSSISEGLSDTETSYEFFESNEFVECSGCITVVKDSRDSFYAYGMAASNQFLVLSILTSVGGKMINFNVYLQGTILKPQVKQGLRFLALELNSHATVQQADRSLYEFWMAKLEQSWEKFNLRRGWDAVIYRHFCDSATLSCVIVYSEATFLTALHRFSPILVRTMGDEMHMNLLMECLRNSFTSFYCLEL